MRSYPNMSYCMCENTLLAMRQIMEAMHEEGPMFLKEMSSSEKQAYQRLFVACEEFMSMSEELEDEADYEETL